MEIKYDIIIPSWNQLDLTIKCIQSIQKYSKNFRIIFIDNGSDLHVFHVIQSILQDVPHILVRNPQNLGFVKATNQGMKLTTAPFFVLMNNDTEAVKNWLELLEAPFDYFPEHNVIATGGKTTTKDSWQGNYPEGEKGVVLVPENGMLAFFCTMFKHEAITNVGLLDEDFGVGLGDDDDYCNRLHRAGYRLGFTKNVTIPHHHRSTFKKLYSDEQIKKMQKNALNKLNNKDYVLEKT